MVLLFWILWIIDLLLAILAVGGGGFRSSFGANTDLNTWVTIGLILVLLASLTLRFVFKLRLLSLIVVALPLLIGLLAYLVDTRKKIV